MSRRQTWPAAIAGGVAGTAAMTVTLGLHVRMRHGGIEVIDYDATDHVTAAASKVIRWQPRTDRQQRALFNLVHWGYGSAVAVQYDELRRLLGDDRRATLAFFVACQATAMTLFPVLGGTPPPWKWRRAVLLSSIGEHALYAVTVARVSRVLRDARAGDVPA